MKKIVRTIFILILITGFVGTLVFLYNKSKKEADVYANEKPFYSDIVNKTVATGSVVPRYEVDIVPQVSGIIDELFVEAGDKVSKGQIVARIKIIPDMVTLNAAENRLNRAKINFEDAQTDYERMQKLFDKNVISYEDFKQARVDYQAAKEELNAAENNLELIKNGVTKKAGTATNTLVRATISGMVLDVPVKVGNSVIQANTFNAGTTIATVADMSDMIFEGKVDETEVGKIKEGMPIELEVGAIENEKFDAILTYIAPKGVEENGAVQFEIKADVKLKEGQFIRAGYSANANIVLERKDSVLVIPEGLLKFENDSAYVEINIGSEDMPNYEKRWVKTGLSDGINIEIVDGLSPNDLIKGNKIDQSQLKKKEEEKEA